MVAQGGNRRLARVSEAIREELGRLLVRKTNDPTLNWVTITGVKISPDLRHARAFFSAAGVDNLSRAERSLAKAKPYLQRELGRNLRLRYTPKLDFIYDDSLEKGARVDELLREVESETGSRRDAQSDGQKLDRLIDEAENILVVTHRNPDGDAIGSLVGMSGILRLMGKQHIAYCPDKIPETLSFLPGVETIQKEPPGESFNLTLLLDTADKNLLPEGFPEASQRGVLAVIDHHAQHGNLGDFVIRRDASAVGEILYELAVELVWPMDAAVAEALYTSIMSDTGSFRYSSTTEATHRAAAGLLSQGARPWIVATRLYESYPLRRQRALAKVLDTLEISADGRFAQMFATPEMLEKIGAHKEDLDGIVNFGRAIDTVEIAAMMRVKEDGNIKVSFRSKGHIDVGELAARFGGGGHRNASGCTLDNSSIDEARKLIKQAAEECLANASDSAT